MLGHPAHRAIAEGDAAGGGIQQHQALWQPIHQRLLQLLALAQFVGGLLRGHAGASLQAQQHHPQCSKQRCRNDQHGTHGREDSAQNVLPGEALHQEPRCTLDRQRQGEAAIVRAGAYRITQQQPGARQFLQLTFLAVGNRVGRCDRRAAIVHQRDAATAVRAHQGDHDGDRLVGDEGRNGRLVLMGVERGDQGRFAGQWMAARRPACMRLAPYTGQHGNTVVAGCSGDQPGRRAQCVEQLLTGGGTQRVLQLRFAQPVAQGKIVGGWVKEVGNARWHTFAGARHHLGMRHRLAELQVTVKVCGGPAIGMQPERHLWPAIGIADDHHALPAFQIALAQVVQPAALQLRWMLPGVFGHADQARVACLTVRQLQLYGIVRAPELGDPLRLELVDIGERNQHQRRDQRHAEANAAGHHHPARMKVERLECVGGGCVRR